MRAHPGVRQRIEQGIVPCQTNAPIGKLTKSADRVIDEGRACCAATIDGWLRERLRQAPRPFR